MNEYNKKYHKKQQSKINASIRHKNRMLNDLEYRMIRNIRNRIYEILIDNTKFSKTFELLGCNRKQFKQYVESQFQEGMAWDNYGSKWHLDHFIPLSWFNLKNLKQQKLAFHHSNFQPLWKKDNLKKRDINLFCYKDNFITEDNHKTLTKKKN